MNKIAMKLTAVLAAGILCGCTAAPAETTTDPTTEPVVTTVPPTVPTTVPEETYPEETLPMETIPVVEAPAPGSISYEEYLELDVDVQQAYYESFASSDAFFLWLEEAQAAYEATRPTSNGMEEGVEDWE